MKIKNYHLIVLFVLMCIFTLNSCGSDSTVQPVTTPTPTTFTVKGTVTNSQAQPVEGVTCTLEVYGLGIAGSVIYTAQTDSSGKYSFPNISAGRYKLSTTKDGYVKVNTIFNASNSQIYSTVNVIMVRYDEWNAVMGSDHPYNANTGYIMVTTMDSVITDGTRGKDMTAQFDPMGSVSVQLVSNKDGAHVVYQSRGYLNNNGTMDWSVMVTFAKGIAFFYDVRTGEASTISATKSGYYFTTVTDAVSSAGEINHYILIGTKGGVGGYSTAIQRVADLSPIKGICYQPSPHDFKGDGKGTYYDADFCNDSCKKWWGTENGEGRDDLRKFSEIGVNFLHVYSMNQSGSGRNHINFMNYCDSLKMHMAFSVNTYYVSHLYDPQVNTWFDNFVSEAYNTGTKVRHPAVVMWCVGNEYDLGLDGQTADLIAKTVIKIIEAETRAGIPEENRIAITSPVSFGTFGDDAHPGIVKIKELKAAFEANGLSTVWSNRFIATVNPFNSGSYLKDYIQKTFPEQLPGLPFCFFEMGTAIGANGVTDEQGQATYIDSQLVNVLPLADKNADKNGSFFGTCIFETINEPEGYKQREEATYGIYKISNPAPTDGQYGVDTWSEKPNFSIVRKNYLSK